MSPCSDTPLVTAIVSTYAAERFIRGCLDDLVAQTIFPEMEVLVIDSGSPQGESAICASYARRHPQIRVVRTQREPLYVAWNRALGLARGRYLTSANTDDRHCHDFFERAVLALESRPGVGLVYADQYISHAENETHAQCKARNARVRRWPDYTPVELIARCITGSQPVWRAELHRKLGGFDTSYRITADYDFWLRTAEKMDLFRLDGTLGVFFDSPHTISGSANRAAMEVENLRIKRACMTRPFWRAQRGAASRVASGLFSAGYQHIEMRGDWRSARPFLRSAVGLQPWNLAYLKTYLLRCVLRFGGSGS